MKYHSLLLALIINQTANAYLSNEEIEKAATIRNDVFSQKEFEEKIISNPSINSIEKVIPLLPNHFKRNVTFKRGTNIDKGGVVGTKGPHGHLVGPNSKSSDPEAPRVIAWDEFTGFTMSWNGEPHQSAYKRIDLYEFDFDTNTHKLSIWNPEKNQKTIGGEDCMSCHGPTNRPIFAMYPDWPQFYGEFNDELAGYPGSNRALRRDLKPLGEKYQKIERTQYINFVKNNGQNHPRYAPLFEAKQIKEWIENPYKAVNANFKNPYRNSGFHYSNYNVNYFPYRPDNGIYKSNVSRAFHFRPNLRIGVLYNRLIALETFEKMKKAPLFNKFNEVIMYSLMDCDWGYVPGTRKAAFSALEEEIKKLNLNMQINWSGSQETQGTKLFKNHYTDNDYDQVPQEEILKMLGLNIAEVDIRFKYNTSLTLGGYNVFDPRAFYHTESVMDIGYLKPRYLIHGGANFSYDNSSYMKGKKFFNSYFDGTATTNELVAAQFVKFMATNSSISEAKRAVYSKFNNSSYLETLKGKYGENTSRMALDAKFFDRVDSMSPWIPLPYPPTIYSYHNRDPYWNTKWEQNHKKEGGLCKTMINNIYRDFYK